MAKRYTFEVRDIDAWTDAESGWTWNDSFRIGEFKTRSDNQHGQKIAFRRFLRKQYGIIFRPHMTIIEDMGDILEIQDRHTREPLFAAIYMGPWN